MGLIIKSYCYQLIGKYFSEDDEVINKSLADNEMWAILVKQIKKSEQQQELG